jgi:hypothetical protein
MDKIEDVRIFMFSIDAKSEILLKKRRLMKIFMQNCSKNDDYYSTARIKEEIRQTPS